MFKGKTFINTLIKSLTKPSYYNDVVKAKFSFSFKYFVLLGLLTSLISVTVMGARQIPNMKNGINRFVDETIQAYPEDLVISAQNGSVKVNREGTFIVPMPKDFIDFQNKELPEDSKYPQKFKNFVVIDQKGTVTDLEKHETLFLINDANILSMGREGVQSKTTKGIPDGQITKQKITQYGTDIKKWADVIPLAIFSAVFAFGTLLTYITKLVQSVFIGTIYWFFAMAIKKSLTITKAIQITLHTTTLPILMEVAILIANPNTYLETISLIVFGLHIAWGFLVVYKLKKD